MQTPTYTASMSRWAAWCGRTTRRTAPSSSWPAAARRRCASGWSPSTLRHGGAGAQVRLGQGAALPTAFQREAGEGMGLQMRNAAARLWCADCLQVGWSRPVRCLTCSLRNSAACLLLCPCRQPRRRGATAACGLPVPPDPALPHGCAARHRDGAGGAARGVGAAVTDHLHRAAGRA